MNVIAPTPTPPPTPTPQTAAEKLKAPTVLVLGPTGAGKTDSLTSLMECGLELFVLGTEPNFQDTLLDAVQRRGLDINKLHYQYVPPAAPGLDALELMAQNVAEMSFENLSKIKSGIGKDKTQQFRQLLRALKNFTDQNGVEFGEVFKFDLSRAFAIDSLSGINKMAKDLMVGYKPTAAEGEWGVSMNLEENLLTKLTSDMKCFFVLTAHVEKGVHELTGTRNFGVSALGRKLGPKIPPMFSEVVLAKRGTNAKTFKWSTSDVDVDLKNRALPISPDLPPSFVQIWEVFKKRQQQLQLQQKEVAK